MSMDTHEASSANGMFCHGMKLIDLFFTCTSTHSALGALEKEVGLKFVEEKLQRGSQLMELVYERLEAQAAAETEGSGDTARRRREEELLQPGDPASVPRALLSTAHLPAANVLCVAALPDAGLAVAGAADGCLRALAYPALSPLHELRVGRSGVLCLDAAPAGSHLCVRPCLVAGCMDGSVVVVELDGKGGTLRSSCRPHAK